LTLRLIKEIKSLFIVNYSKYTVPDDQILIKLIDKIPQEGITIDILQENLKEVNNIYLIRSLLWMNKFNIINIEIN